MAAVSNKDTHIEPKGICFKQEFFMVIESWEILAFTVIISRFVLKPGTQGIL